MVIDLLLLLLLLRYDTIQHRMATNVDVTRWLTGRVSD